MSQNNNTAVFILSNRRAKKIPTIRTLRHHGYTGKIYIILDDLDETKQEYIDLHKNSVDDIIVFNKQEAANYTDICENTGNLRGVVYARNAAFNIAKDLKLDYFLVLDDDYTSFQFRFDSKFNYHYKGCRNLDACFDVLYKFLEKCPKVVSIALTQGGDFIGGSECKNAQALTLTRKCMNSFFCATDRPFKFLGRINEDVNAYVLLGSQGKIFFTTNYLSLQQLQTQANSGGLTELYLDSGTYVKSFYSVMCHPSSVKIRMMGNFNMRIHHSVTWKNTIPIILRESNKKT